MTVLGYKGTPQERRDTWNAMLLYKKGSIELKEHKDTYDIAVEDSNRYRRVLNSYLKKAA